MAHSEIFGLQVLPFSPAILLFSAEHRNSFDPPFDLELDWHNMRLAAGDAQGNLPDAVAWEDFERWWRDRSGDDEGHVALVVKLGVKAL